MTSAAIGHHCNIVWEVTGGILGRTSATRKQKIVKKAYENIAPGPVEKLKAECFQHDKKKKKEKSCYHVCARRYCKHQEEIQEYSYSQLFARKTLMERIFKAKMGCWINSTVSCFMMLSMPENIHQMIRQGC